MATRDNVDWEKIPKVEDSTSGAGRVCTDRMKHLGVFCWGTNQHVMALMDLLWGICVSCDIGSLVYVSPDDESAWKRADRFSSVVIFCPSQTFEASEDSLRRFLDSCFTTHGPENMMVVITDLEDTESEKRRIAEWKEGEYPRCPLATLTEAEMDVIITSDTADVSAERRMVKKVNRMREILQSCTGSSGNALQRLSKNKAIVGIFSREADSQYSWLVDLLLSDVFMDDIAEVRPCRISNSGWQQFHQDVSRCTFGIRRTFGILYHSKNGGRINVTDVNGSLYDEELEHLYSRLGKKKVIVVIDDLSDSSDQQKTNILRNQPSIMNMAQDLFLISHEEKTSSYQRRPMVDREQVRRKLQMVIEKMRKRKNDCKKNTGGSLQWIMHQIASHITSSLSGMSEPYPETADNISSTKLIAEHIMASSFSAKGTDTSDLVPQVTGDNKYRIEVETKVIIECSVQSGSDYMNLNQKNDYELLEPTVNEQGDSGTVSAVHLPLYICPDGLKDQSMIKFDFKDWKTVLKTPTSTKPSVVLKHPNFSCVTATVEQDKSINGKVILYFRVVCPEKEDHMEYRIHLYLLYPDIPHLKDLDDLKRDHGFNRIDKPSQTTGSVYTETNYMICLIGGKRNRSIWPKVLQFIVHKEINNHPFAEINISKNAILKSANPISLQVVAENSSELEPVWECRLSRADIEEASGQAVQRGITPEHFVDKHRVQLIQNVRYIKPVLDDLKKKGLLKEEQCSIITSQLTPQDQMRELLCFVQFWGRKDKDTFYKIVKNHNGPIIKEMERKN